MSNNRAGNGQFKNGGINLLMVVHCHQPAGNFDWVFKEAYDKSYLPFIQTLQRHPGIKVALHYSGCLFDWIKEKRPEFLEMLKGLVKTGQVEMAAGGYGEPILPLIPDRDKLGQIRMHTDFIREQTGYNARGAWLTERVWEPYLARIFSQAKIAYTVVDDSHFELAGKKAEEILGYFLTEEEGHTVAILASSKKLRYSMPFKLPADTIDYLKSVATAEGDRAVTFGDDGEKFGLWPHTYKWVYEEKWLDKFFSALEDNKGWINVITPAEYIEKYPPLGRIYLPCASYPEMLEWSGGYFRNFLVKYPEANWMHKRMLYVSDKLNSIKAAEPKIKEARNFLYNAQCNCSYWHGVFGGLYLHHLRNAVFTNLINSQKAMEGLEKPKALPRSEVLDIDKDGYDEIFLESPALNVFIKPASGGSILEIDYKQKSLNVVNTLTRRPEAYHKKIKERQNVNNKTSCPGNGVASIHDAIVSKDKDLDNFLNYDLYQKAFCLDHFLSPGANAENFAKAKFREAGNFIQSSYKYDIQKTTAGLAVLFEKTGVVTVNEQPRLLKLDKTLRLDAKDAVVGISYKIKNMLDSEIAVWFGSEYNMSLMDPEFCKIGELLAIDKLEIEDEWFKVFLEYKLSKKADVWFCPVETVSESEAGFEKTYQELCVLFNWKIALKPGQHWSVDINFSIR